MIERANYEKVQIFLACLLALNDLGLSKTTSRIWMCEVCNLKITVMYNCPWNFVVIPNKVWYGAWEW